jgi:isoprenylcysteine carboxyl methyltransferase (ICMT) family protein YpbQ
MTSHLGLMLLFAFFVSLVFATIAKDTPREQAQLGAQMFVTFLGAAIILGWVMRILPL